VKFTIATALFNETITAAMSSVPGKPPTPALGGILIEAQVGAVTLSSFNYDRATRRTAAADVGEADTVLVSGRLLSVVGANLPRSEDTSVEVSGSEMVVTAGRTAFRLPLMQVGEFPNLPSLTAEDSIGTVDCDAIAAAVQVVGGFAAADDAAVVDITGPINGLNLTFEPGGLWLCSTDRYIFGRRRLEWNGNTDADSITVHAADLVSTIKAVVGPSIEDAEFLYNGSMFGLKTSVATVMTRCLAGKFPEVPRALAPATYSALSTVSTSDLTFMLRRAASIADDKNSQVDIEVDAGGLAVTTTKSAFGKVDDSIASHHQGEYRRITLSAHRLHNALALVDEPDVTLAFRKTGHLVGIHPGQLERTDAPVELLQCPNFALLIGIQGVR
jgi:DNA polymerase III subunit beta